MAGHKDCDIISVRGNFCPVTANEGDSAQSWICPYIPKPSEQGLQSKDMEKREQGPTLLDQPFDCESLRALSVHLHHCPVVMVQHADPFEELQFESSGLQIHHQKLMVHPIESFGLI